MPNTSDCPGSDGTAASASRERPPRASVMLSATVERFGGGGPTKHRVRDLSPGGVRIDQAADLRMGATVLVTVGALEAIGATVVWVREGTAGLKFAQPIDPNDAKAKVAIAVRPAPAPTDHRLKAGWTLDLRNPYKKER
ncbi:PilZ domain-containing protein [Sphingomonas sp. PB2P19]|uniref:PilZ domain-containing protein n=1 Tax=Sphingomonas rhamnosi TaxID=3096156 RepID=UPI002FCAC027